VDNRLASSYVTKLGVPFVCDDGILFCLHKYRKRPKTNTEKLITNKVILSNGLVTARHYSFQDTTNLISGCWRYLLFT